MLDKFNSNDEMGICSVEEFDEFFASEIKNSLLSEGCSRFVTHKINVETLNDLIDKARNNNVDPMILEVLTELREEL